MALLMNLARRLELISMKFDISARRMNIKRQLRQLAQYAANIADGNVSFREMGAIPSAYFARQSIFQQYAHNRALQVANWQMATMAPMMMMQMQGQNPQMMQMYQNSMFMQLYSSARKEAAEEEKKLLNEQEKDLQEQDLALEAQEKSCDAEIQGIGEKSQQDHQIFRA